MRLVKSSSAIKRNNSDLCKVTEYHIGDKEIDFAIVELSGRYLIKTTSFQVLLVRCALNL